MNLNDSYDDKISTAVVLAAGNGHRLLPFTKTIPKCLLEINGKPILHQLIDSLQSHNFKKIIIVVGYLANKIIDSIQESNRWNNIVIDFVHSEAYASTNNIYSLWLVRDIVNEPFLLLESDIIFESFMLKPLLSPDRIAIVNYKSTMNGTTLVMNNSGNVHKMKVGKSLNELRGIIKKTVNICSLSLYSWDLIKEKLGKRIEKGLKQDYYESVFSELITEGNLYLLGIDFNDGRWYEIDTVDDLNKAKRLLSFENTIQTESEIAI